MFKIHCFAELYLANATEGAKREILSFHIVYITTDCVTSQKCFGHIKWSLTELLWYTENLKKLLFSKITIFLDYFS